MTATTAANATHWGHSIAMRHLRRAPMSAGCSHYRIFEANPGDDVLFLWGRSGGLHGLLEEQERSLYHLMIAWDAPELKAIKLRADHPYYDVGKECGRATYVSAPSHGYVSQLYHEALTSKLVAEVTELKKRLTASTREFETLRNKMLQVLDNGTTQAPSQ